MRPAKYLTVDLTKGRCALKDLPPGLLSAYLGGRGLSYRLLKDNLPQKAKPLEHRSPLVFCAGLLAGTAAPASGRMQITSLSPATGIMGSSNAGGFFATNLAANRIIALVITGRARHPVCLWIKEGKAEIQNARELWGLDTWQTSERLGQSKRVQTAVIGPAGENLSSLACVILGKHSAAGRTGMGAVMGSKNLKAVVAEASSAKPAPAPPKAKELMQNWLKELRASEYYQKTSQEGQSGYIPWAHDMGILGTRNFQEVNYPESRAFESEHMLKHRGKRRGCARCPVNCKADFKIQGGEHDGLSGPRPEFESLAALGPRCGINEPEPVFRLSNLCGRLGIDTISAGACAAFAMELYEKGIIDKDRTGGLELEWGNAPAAEELLKGMALRQGFGGVLSNGVAQAAEQIGKGAGYYAYTVKGLELSAYDPRTLKGTALGYAVAGRGGDFGCVFPTPEYRWTAQRAQAELGNAGAADRFSESGKPELIRRCLIVNAVLDSLGMCKVPALGIINDFSLEFEAGLATALGLIETDACGLMLAGERIVNLERLINMGQGASVKDDRLPERFIAEPAPSGAAQGQTVGLEAMLAGFYRAMGWDEMGRPTPDKLRQLNLEPAEPESETAASGMNSQRILI